MSQPDRQLVVVEWATPSDAGPVAAWGPFDNGALAHTFAAALRTFPARTGQITVLELNKEPLG